ncbi:peptidase [Brevibacillus borstelensis]|uniref:peptidase n=1 Tax=Brevibacillus borstelensis TaxID=45462 RepID=UPI0030D06D7A
MGGEKKNEEKEDKYSEFHNDRSLSMFLMSTPASAATYSDPYQTPKIHGYEYYFESMVWDRNPPGNDNTHPTVEAVAFVKSIGTNVPVGYMAGQARLFNSAGELRSASSMTYNDSKISGIYVYSPRTTTSGEYYAQSRAEFYNGDGYTRYTGYKSPIQVLGKSTKIAKVIDDLMLKTEYDVNSNGETYGSALSEYTIGEEPDLISAVGTNGIKGYVRADDLTPNVSSIEEAIEQNGDNGDVRTIPLYDVDGSTVLGEFELITHYELKTDIE